MQDTIRKSITESLHTKEKLLSQSHLIEQAAHKIILSISSGHRLLTCGNGGSAADAEHFACELVGRFERDRHPYPAIALTTNSQSFTAIANDYGYENVFSRQVHAQGKKGDVLVGISTSGNSPNVLNAIIEAKKIGIKTIGLLGRDGGKIAAECDIAIVVDSHRTPRIQECHELIMHIICELMDEKMK
jgi:D-sedoheptulose 7-phosphate isomerase